MNKRHQFWIGDSVEYAGQKTKITGIAFDPKTNLIKFNLEGIRDAVAGEQLKRIANGLIKNIGSAKHPVTR